MFSHDKEPGRAVCLADYRRIKRGAVVPQGNELWADVEAWLAEGSTLGAFAGYPETRPLDEIKAAKHREIDAAYSAELAAILNDYPEAERLTWDKQEQEARAFAADSTASTPYLDALAAARELALSDLAARIIAKADAWAEASATATGKRQRLEASIDAAEDVTTLEAITW